MFRATATLRIFGTFRAFPAQPVVVLLNTRNSHAVEPTSGRFSPRSWHLVAGMAACLRAFCALSRRSRDLQQYLVTVILGG